MAVKPPATRVDVSVGIGARLDIADGASDTGVMPASAVHARFALDPLIAEAKRRARRRRGLIAAAMLTVLTGAGLLVATAGPGRPAAASSPVTGTFSDGALRAALPPGWTVSIGQGFDRTHPLAWVLVGDFRLPRDAAQHEGTPSVPRGRVLVTVGDFFPDGLSRDWPAVVSLHMPRALVVSGHWWSVRYAGRALSIKVRFGSAPTPALLHQVQRLMRGLRRAA